MTNFTCSVIGIDEFGAAVLEITPEIFSEKGFDFGDTLDLAFSSGYALENVPYYNGFYVPLRTPVVVAYPHYEHPTVCFNCANFHRISGVDAGETVTITLHEKGAKKDVMDLRGVVYSNDPGDYTSRTQFANARELRTGRIGAGKLYRCASPFDHQMNRPEAVDEFLREHRIRATFSLSESVDTLKKRHAGMPAYARGLYESGHVIPVGVGSDYFGAEFSQKVAAGLIRALEEPFPWAIHCLEGKDRTGFICLVLGSLMDASYDEMLADYMRTYDNYFGITEQSDPIRYHGFKSTFFDTYLKQLREMAEGEPDEKNYRKGAEAYLKQGGMDESQIAQLRKLLEE